MAEVKETGELSIPGGEELSETIPYYYDPSRFGSMMMDVRHTEMESQGLTYIQPSREDCIPQQMQEQKHAT
ncbi:hypothetical protein HPP92_017007 [Vanilla planifolia]|uniref:Uncharacterized protein n=1 Tax=Vanilla planifolia TaxID=51239 RepID=A0A835QFU6_VANPL|nr:hypothetical protein HPP92_017007 [Vanilla planifolia]